MATIHFGMVLLGLLWSTCHGCELETEYKNIFTVVNQTVKKPPPHIVCENETKITITHAWGSTCNRSSSFHLSKVNTCSVKKNCSFVRKCEIPILGLEPQMEDVWRLHVLYQCSGVINKTQYLFDCGIQSSPPAWKEEHTTSEAEHIKPGIQSVSPLWKEEHTTPRAESNTPGIQSVSPLWKEEHTTPKAEDIKPGIQSVPPLWKKENTTLKVEDIKHDSTGISPVLIGVLVSVVCALLVLECVVGFFLYRRWKKIKQTTERATTYAQDTDETSLVIASRETNRPCCHQDYHPASASITTRDMGTQTSPQLISSEFGIPDEYVCIRPDNPKTDVTNARLYVKRNDTKDPGYLTMQIMHGSVQHAQNE